MQSIEAVAKFGNCTCRRMNCSAFLWNPCPHLEPIAALQILKSKARVHPLEDASIAKTTDIHRMRIQATIECADFPRIKKIHIVNHLPEC